VLSPEEHRVLALAAIAQCAKLVQSIARRGSASAESIADSLAGIIVLDESDPEIAIGGAKAVALGLSDLMIKRADPLLMERVRTITALIHLEKLLRRDPHTQQELRQQLEAFVSSSDSADITSGSSIKQLAEIYRETVSELGPRIMINGDQQFLEDDRNISTIRALLLAGVRGAYVFAQVGGKKWQLFLRRKNIASIAAALYPYPRPI